MFESRGPDLTAIRFSPEGAVTDPIETMIAARTLTTDDEHESFNKAFNRLPQVLDRSSALRLVDVFDDATGDPQWMYEVIHRIEHLPIPELEDALVSALPRLRERAPEWAEALVMRSLNIPTARLELLARAERGSTLEKVALTTILEAISVYPEAVGSHAREVGDKLQGPFGPGRPIAE